MNSSNQLLHALLISLFFFNCLLFPFILFSSILRLCPSSVLLLASARIMIRSLSFLCSSLLYDTVNLSTLPTLNFKFTTSSADPLPLYRIMLASAFCGASVFNFLTYLCIHFFVTIDRRRAQGPRNREFHSSTREFHSSSSAPCSCSTIELACATDSSMM